MQSTLPLKEGDEVVIGISEKVFLGLTGLIYFVPLCALFLFAIVGQYLTEQFNLNNELLTIVLALIGFAGCYQFIKKLIESFFEVQKINPVILKKI
ncbi:Positive regulator for alginate biosynthesis MucC [Cycloclasticus sp. P1]|nr:Positive regulator for alginate biosynthesis MucC [Cycloclasticus sp. P1]AGS39852.1 Positive regulator for alginate biosynthesis MucC [Cycloclasticus zancles 78-ME]